MIPARNAESVAPRFNAKAVFGDALELPAGERAAYVERACGADSVLRQRVLHLLAVYEASPEFLAAATVDPGPPCGTEVESASSTEPPDAGMERLPRAAAQRQTVASTADEEVAETGTPGASIGPYKLLERIGEGGFGTVYLAEQQQPVRRKVAMKVIKLGMDTRQVIARFEAERQALAMMDHPHIAKVLDGGATETGRPYFVMELVKGTPITHYCDAQRVPLRERLALFTDVCHAVQHAHQKGIIHRDLKPSNVLVSRHDDKAIVKVIDFGIVKATGGALTDKTIHTEWRQLIGTPAYMSPEQAGMSDLDVDTRSDIYSLGVLLYELLTGTPPFDPRHLMSAGYDEMRRIIREVEPPRPSTRVSASAKVDKWEGEKGSGGSPVDAAYAQVMARGTSRSSSQLDIARNRGTDVRALSGALRGEPDWIVMKCLEKDRARRYETAAGLAADVRRYLDGEPVLAAPPSRLYRLRKLLLRNRLPVSIAGAFFVLIAAGLIVSVTLLQRAARARDAESDQRARAEAINTFLKDMLTAADPARAKGEKLTVREALDDAARHIDEGSVKHEPLVEAEIRYTIGSTYYALSLYADAERQLRAADALQSRELGDTDPVTLRTRSRLIEVLADKTDFAPAVALAEQTFKAQKSVLGQHERDTLRTMFLFGSLLVYVDRFAEGEVLLRDAIDLLTEVYGPDEPLRADALYWLADAYIHNTFPEKAEPLLREALRIYTQAHSAEHPFAMRIMLHLGHSLVERGRDAHAESMNRSLLEVNRRVLGDDHIETLHTRISLASALSRQGRESEAEASYREILAALQRTVGPDHFSTIYCQRLLAVCLNRQKKHAEAASLLRGALAIARARYGPAHGDTSVRLMSLLADVLTAQHEDDEAEQIAREVLDSQYRQLPRPNPAELQESSVALIRVLRRRGAVEEALRIERRLIEYWTTIAREPDARSRTVHGAARYLLRAEHTQLRDAPQALELALLANERSGRQDPRFLETLAQAYALTGDSRRATETWAEAIALLPDDESRAEMLNGAAWYLLSETNEAEFRGALAFAVRANDLGRYGNASHLDTLALAHHRLGETAKAIEIQKQALALLAADAPKRAEYEARLVEFERALDPTLDHGP